MTKDPFIQWKRFINNSDHIISFPLKHPPYTAHHCWAMWISISWHDNKNKEQKRHKFGLNKRLSCSGLWIESALLVVWMLFKVLCCCISLSGLDKLKCIVWFRSRVTRRKELYSCSIAVWCCMERCVKWSVGVSVSRSVNIHSNKSLVCKHKNAPIKSADWIVQKVVCW